MPTTPENKKSKRATIGVVLWISVMGAILGSQAGAIAFAGGPHVGGTVVLHAETALVYTDGSSDSCGGSELESCERATVEVAADPSRSTVFYVLAAFPASSIPELIGVSIGIQYDASRFVLDATGACADYEVNTDDWPLPGSGTVLMWDFPRTDHLVEFRWFAGYAVSEGSPVLFELTAHPTQGGYFVGDWPLTPMDPIAGFGSLGFGTEGFLPCPDGPVPVSEESWGRVKALFR